jgi:hypothetical protein
MKKFFDTASMTYFPLKERPSKVDIVSACVSPGSTDILISPALREKAETIANEIHAARAKGASVAAMIQNNGLAIPESRDKFAIPAFIENDANACALAEWYYGAGKGCGNRCFYKNIFSGFSFT